MEYLGKLQNGLDTHEAEIEDLDRFIPPVALDTLKDAKDMVKTKQAICDAINDSGKCDDFHGLAKGMRAFKKMFNPKKQALDTQVKAAKTASGEPASKPPRRTKGG